MFLKRRLVVASLLVLVLLASAGLAQWLRHPRCGVTDAMPDVIYVAAGAGEQERRIDALVDFLGAHPNRSVPAIWLGDDPEKNRWSRKDQANLTTVQWAQLYLSNRLSAIGLSREESRGYSAAPPAIVLRKGHGTDAEMEALASRLAAMNNVSVVGLVTSPYHMRRLVSRFVSHNKVPVTLRLIPAPWCANDFMPWTTVPEVLKLIRDSAGLTDVRLLQRWPCGHSWGLLDLVWVIALVCLVYTWLLYPLLLGLVTAFAKNRPVPSGFHPSRVDVLMAAYNEDKVIEARLANLLDVLEQAGVLPVSHIHVGVDQSTDRTWEVVSQFAAQHPEVVPRKMEQRTGKVGILKALANECRPQDATAAQVFLLTDANTHFSPDAIPMMLRHFSDDRVGGVCGRLVFQKNMDSMLNQNAATSEGAYWTFETWLKTCESKLDSCLGANGAIYMMRQRLFWLAVPDNTIVDDFVLGMKVREQGFAMRYEPGAMAYEELPDEEGEWGRRVRIGAGDYQTMQLCGRCLSPSYGWFAWSFFSHKVMRWLTPHALALLGISSLFIAIGSVINWCSGALCLIRFFLALSVLSVFCVFLVLSLPQGLALSQRHSVLKLLRHFALMQLALMVGFFRFSRGDLKGHWNRTART